MQDHRKTKAQLVEELQALRARIGGLAEPDTDAGEQTSGVPEPDEFRSDRRDIEAEIKFIGDFGLTQASAVNLSPGGMCFEVAEEIPFEMEFELEGEVHQHRAHLVWMKPTESGGSQLGFRFVPPASTETSGILWLYKELRELNETDE